jgi:hypothetical protein
MRAATALQRLRLGIAHADDGEDHGLVAAAVESRGIEIGLGSFDRDLLDSRGGEPRQERIAVRLVTRWLELEGRLRPPGLIEICYSLIHWNTCRFTISVQAYYPMCEARWIRRHRSSGPD